MFSPGLVSSLLLCSACSLETFEWQGSPYDPPKPAPEIKVTNTTGNSLALSELRGTITVLYFGYTYCPDVCPATVAIMRQVFDQIEAPSGSLNFIMLSVDPERETPDSVDAYMRRFHPDFIGLWVERNQLDQILDDYSIIAIREPSENPDTYLITHTARVFLIDKEGNLRTHYPFGSVPADFVTDIEYLQTE